MKRKMDLWICVLFLFWGYCCTPPPAKKAPVTYYAEADTLFKQAAAQQKAKDFPAAIVLYKQLLNLTPPDTETGQKAGSIVKEALIQMMYCHFFTGQRGSAAAYYESLYTDTANWIVKQYPRNVEICLGYSLYEAARLPEAVTMIGKALSRPDEGIQAEELYADYGIAGAIYNQSGNISQAIECTEKCAAILRTLDNKTDLINALGNLIYQYQQIGNFDKSLAAYEELIALKEVKDNLYHRCVAEVNIISLFDEWGLEEEVGKHLQIARQTASACGIPEARLRVKNLEIYLLLEKEDTEAAAVVLDTLSALQPEGNEASIYRTYYENYRLIVGLLRDSDMSSPLPEKAFQRLKELQAAPLDRLPCDICFLMGKALSRRGYTAQAITAYEGCLPYVEKNRLLHLQRKAYTALADLYAQQKNYAVANRYHKLYDTTNRAFTERRNVVLMSQFRVKYETREKERANELLRAEVRLQQRSLQYYTVVGVAFALLAAAVILWGIMRHRTLRLQHENDTRQHEIDLLQQEEAARVIREQDTRLREMIQERLEMNRKNEDLRIRIENSKTEQQLQKLMESLLPRLLTSEEEQDFRQQFIRIHPAFLVNLRNKYPTVTRNEELLAMLIRLNLTNEEISLALNITRSSVNTSRFRLRRKFALSTEESLDDFIRIL